MLLFLKLVQETQMPTPLEATRQNNLTKLLVLLPLRANSKRTFQCETPCSLPPLTAVLHPRWSLFKIQILGWSFKLTYNSDKAECRGITARQFAWVGSL